MSDSLGGTAKTLMFVNVSPADYNTDETVTSLMYASRVKLITNDVSRNPHCDDAAVTPVFFQKSVMSNASRRAPERNAPMCLCGFSLQATKQVESKQIATMKDAIKSLTLIIEKMKKGEDVSELEKQLNQRKAAGARDEGPPPPEEPANEEEEGEFEEPPDLPAD